MGNSTYINRAVRHQNQAPEIALAGYDGCELPTLDEGIRLLRTGELRESYEYWKCRMMVTAASVKLLSKRNRLKGSE